jgi:hypothetical protein
LLLPAALADQENEDHSAFQKWVVVDARSKEISIKSLLLETTVLLVNAIANDRSFH